MKYNTQHIYEAPTLKALRLGGAPLMDSASIVKAKGNVNDVAESKAFWGPTLFDDQDEDNDGVIDAE